MECMISEVREQMRSEEICLRRLGKGSSIDGYIFGQDIAWMEMP